MRALVELKMLILVVLLSILVFGSAMCTMPTHRGAHVGAGLCGIETLASAVFLPSDPLMILVLVVLLGLIASFWRPSRGLASQLWRLYFSRRQEDGPLFADYILAALSQGILQPKIY